VLPSNSAIFLFVSYPFRIPTIRRFDAALKEVSNTSTQENLDFTMGKLAIEFQKTYGKEALSAASKFLGIRHRLSVFISDGRAFTCLKRSADSNLRESYYGGYLIDGDEIGPPQKNCLAFRLLR